MGIEQQLLTAFFTPMGEHTAREYAGQTNWGMPVLLWGPPGGGKTSKFRQLSRHVDCDLYVFKITTKGYGNFGVTPIPDLDRGVLHFLPPSWVADFRESNNSGLVVIDEMQTAAPALQAPLLGLLQDKEIGSSSLPPRCRIVATTNEVEDSAGGFSLASAVANRQCHLVFEDPKIEDWAKWLINGAQTTAPMNLPFVDAEEQEQHVLDNWAEAWANAAGLFVGFSLAKRSWHRQQPKAGDAQASKAWTSPRSKEYATRLVASGEIHALNDLDQRALVAGCCGDAFAREFFQWKRLHDLPNTAAFLDGKAHFEHNAARLDRTGAVVSSALSLLKNKDARTETRIKNFFLFLDSVADDALDLVCSVMADNFEDLGLTKNKAAIPVLKKLRPMLEATEIGAK